MSELTIKEAYLAMYSFLESEYKLTKSDEIGGLLGDLSLLQDGSSADPAAEQQWSEAVKKAKAGEVDAALKFV